MRVSRIYKLTFGPCEHCGRTGSLFDKQCGACQKSRRRQIERLERDRERARRLASRPGPRMGPQPA
ncbi:MAG: hypothetical protein C4551_02380 [Bacillota bacterium]|nr:MAG: hypothetical protein C4551_02380 [Bacillota bacterium]